MKDSWNPNVIIEKREFGIPGSWAEEVWVLSQHGPKELPLRKESYQAIPVQCPLFAHVFWLFHNACHLIGFRVMSVESFSAPAVGNSLLFLILFIHAKRTPENHPIIMPMMCLFFVSGSWAWEVWMLLQLGLQELPCQEAPHQAVPLRRPLYHVPSL